MNLKERKTAKKKEEILRSAINIISIKGIQKVTMEDIATDLLMTKGSLYYYFKNKEDLIFQSHILILSDSVSDVSEHIKDAKTATDKFKRAARFHVLYVIENQETYNLIVKPQEEFPKRYLEQILAKRQEYEGVFDRIIKEGIANGEFTITEIQMSRMIALGAMNWIQQWYTPNGNKSKQEIADIYSEYLLKILI